MKSELSTPEEIKRLRVKAGLTQKDTADLFGISLNYWQKKELSKDSTQNRKVSKSEYILLLLLAGEHPDFKLVKHYTGSIYSPTTPSSTRKLCCNVLKIQDWQGSTADITHLRPDPYAWLYWLNFFD